MSTTLSITTRGSHKVQGFLPHTEKITDTDIGENDHPTRAKTLNGAARD